MAPKKFEFQNQGFLLSLPIYVGLFSMYLGTRHPSFKFEFQRKGGYLEFSFSTRFFVFQDKLSSLPSFTSLHISLSLSLSLHANKENCHCQFSLPLSTTLLPSPWPNQLDLPSSNLKGGHCHCKGNHCN